MNKRDRSKLYDNLYELADRYVQRYNPCKINSKGECLTGNCCCSGCKYLGKQGCTTKCLLCKIHLCSESSFRNPIVAGKLKVIEEIAKKYNLLGARKSKKETLSSHPFNLRIINRNYGY